MRRLVGCLVILLLGNYVKAQTCTQLLNRAEDNYEAGKLLAIIKEDAGVLDFMECLDQKGVFTKDEEIRAKKLLTKVYIFTDDEAKAEIALINLLKADPEHILDPQTDPAELLYLMQQFRTAPIFRVSFRFGATVCDPYIIGDYSVTSIPKFYNGKTAEGESTFKNELGDFSSDLGASIGVQMEMILERKLYEGLDGSFGAQYRTSKYNVESFINNNFNTVLSNNQRYVRLPLGLKYTLWNTNRAKGVLPYVFTGVSLDYLLAAYYESSRSGGNTFTVTKNTGDVIGAGTVNRLNYSYYGGLGAKFRVKTHFVTIDVRYDTSQKNYIDSNDRFIGNKFMIFDSAFAEDNLSLNFLSATVGFTYSVHKPRKLKEYR